MKKFAYLVTTVAAFVIGGLSTAASYDEIDISSGAVPSIHPGVSVSRGNTAPKVIVIHSAGFDVPMTFRSTLNTFTGPSKLSTHYLIPDKTAAQLQEETPSAYKGLSFKHLDNIPLFKLVAGTKSAQHAGVSKWSESDKLPGCETSLNRCSIGITLYTSTGRFYPQQIFVLIGLLKKLTKAHGIDPRLVLGHNVVSFGRMKNPGPNFPWETLFLLNHGFGYIPTPARTLPSVSSAENYVRERLKAIGFGLPEDAPWSTTTKGERSVLACLEAYRNQFMGGAEYVAPKKAISKKPKGYGVKPGNTTGFFAERAEQEEFLSSFPEGVDEALLLSLAGFDTKVLRVRG